MTKLDTKGALATVTLLAILASAASSARAQVTDMDLSWVDWNNLAAGEVELRAGKLDRWIVTMDAAILVRASHANIWSILTACEVAPEYVPNVVACERIDSINEGQSELFNQTVKPVFFVPRFEHVFRLDYHPPDRIDFERVSGPLAVFNGSWRMPQQADGTVLLVHSLQLRAGIPLPRIFVRSTLRRDLPIVLTAIRDRAEALARD